MSVSAHRILKVEYASETSFNLSADEKLVEFLENGNNLGFYCQMNDNGGGVVSVSIEALQAAIDKADDLGLDEFTVKVLGEDIAAAVNMETDSVEYDCF